MQDILVIGRGNPLRGDDGVGWKAVDMLSEIVDDPRVRFLKCQELAPEISQPLAEARYAIFIDVSLDGNDGVVGKKMLYPSSKLPEPGTHNLEPGGILAFSRLLFGSAPESVMLSIKGKSFEYKDEISDQLLLVLDSLVKEAGDLIAGRLLAIASNTIELHA